MSVGNILEECLNSSMDRLKVGLNTIIKIEAQTRARI